MAAPAKYQHHPVAPPPHDTNANPLTRPTTPTESDAKSSSEVKDAALAKLEEDKTMSFIKAWEESRKTKAQNRAEKRQSKVTSWENSKKASLEAQLKKMHEQLEKKKAECAERMKNKEALIHKKAEEKRAVVEAKKGEELLKAESMAAKYRAAGQVPNSCFSFLGI